jgi:hypothetical protein
MDAEHIRQIVAKYFTDKLWAVHFEVGIVKSGRLRVDVLATNMRSEIVIVEIKSSVADFKADKKMGLYAKYCDKLYLAMSEEVYAKVKHLVPKGIGVFLVGRVTMRNKKRATINEIKRSVRLNVITRMAYRSASATRGKRKNKEARPQFLAKLAVDSLYDCGDLPNRMSARHIVAESIKRYV